MKFGQLTEYNMRNIFLKSHTQNMVEKLVPDLFTKNQNWAYLWINSLKCYKCYCYCLLYAQVEVYQNISKLSYWPFAFILYTEYKKTWTGTSLPTSYFTCSLKENVFLMLYFVIWPNFIVWLLLLLELLGNMCTVNICFTVCDIIKFEINHSFLNKSFFCI